MKILVLNCGSSTIKFKLFKKDDLSVLCCGLVDRMLQEDANITIRVGTEKKKTIRLSINCYREGINEILQLLIAKELAILNSLDEIAAVAHRVAAGGDKFRESTIVTKETVQAIKDASPFAPLHNPPNIEGILAAQSLLGDITQVAVFDTAFHRSIPQKAYMYGLPYEMYTEYGIRKIGFHGTSFRYASQRASEFLNVPYNQQRIVVCHLGGGASVAAIKNGKSVDVSLGMTSLSGIMMGTRCGDLDPGIMPFIIEQTGLTIDEINGIMYDKSGLLGVSGVSSDMRDVEKAALKGNERAQLAMDVFAYQIKKQVGSFVAILGGLDILVFTGGIGENHVYTRQQVCDEMEYLGIELDEEKNKVTFGKDTLISMPNSKVKVLVVTTDEELMIAKDAVSLL